MLLAFRFWLPGKSWLTRADPPKTNPQADNTHPNLIQDARLSQEKYRSRAMNMANMAMGNVFPVGRTRLWFRLPIPIQNCYREFRLPYEYPHHLF